MKFKKILLLFVMGTIFTLATTINADARVLNVYYEGYETVATGTQNGVDILDISNPTSTSKPLGTDSTTTIEVSDAEYTEITNTVLILNPDVIKRINEANPLTEKLQADYIPYVGVYQTVRDTISVGIIYAPKREVIVNYVDENKKQLLSTKSILGYGDLEFNSLPGIIELLLNAYYNPDAIIMNYDAQHREDWIDAVTFNGRSFSNTYNITKEKILGYEFVSADASLTGKFDAKLKAITLTYKKIKQTTKPSNQKPNQETNKGTKKSKKTNSKIPKTGSNNLFITGILTIISACTYVGYRRAKI